KAVLVNVTGGLNMTLLEVDEAANAISEQVDPEANIIFGAAFDPGLDGVVRVSVVATGMDSGSITLIEPQSQRRAVGRVEPLRIPEPVRAPAPTYEPVSYETETVSYAEPEALEPEPVMQAPAEELQGDLLAAAAEPAPAPVPEPVVVQAPVSRIVDAAIEEIDEEDAPLFPAGRVAAERRPQRGGFMSLFGGRPRYDAPPPAPKAAAPRPAPVRGGAQPLEVAQEAEAVDTNEDLEIPSFLRRLAN
ncbi:MAG: cell division protein FtsZ, partial [Phenylobacterium sp.]